MRKPTYRTKHKAYYILHNGKQTVLARGPKDDATYAAAVAAWAVIQGLGQPEAEPQAPLPAAGPTLATIIDEWLEYVKRDKSTATYASYHRYATAWKELHGAVPAAEIKPFHVRKLIDQRYTNQENGEPFSGSVRAQAEKVTLGIFAWALKEELVERNTVKGYERKAEFGKRKGWINDEQFAKLLTQCTDDCFRDLLEVLWLTGARPFEIFQIEKRHFQREHRRLVLRRADGDKVKAKPREKEATRTIYLLGKSFDIVCRLADQFDSGVLFRNRDGKRWQNTTTSRRMVTMTRASGVRCQTTGEQPTIYHLRHSWATLAPIRGIDIETARKQLGQKSTKMLMEIYDHSGDDSTFMLSKLKLVA